MNRKERRRAAAEAKRRRGRSTTQDDSPFISSHPFEGIPQDELRTALAEAGRNALTQLPALQDHVLASLKTCDPKYFLANMSQYALMAGVTNNGNVVEPRTGRTALQQFHIEFAQAAYLTVPPELLDFERAHPSDIQKLIDSLIDLYSTFQTSRYSRIADTSGETEKRLLALQERIRLHTAIVRNWGDYTQVLSILRRLYSPLDDLYSRQTGLSATDLIHIFDTLIKRIEQRALDYRSNLAPALAKTTKKEMIEEYCKRFKLPDSFSSDTFDFIRKNNWSRNGLVALLVSHSGLFVRDIYQFSKKEISTWINKEEELIEKALKPLSLAFGELKDQTLNELFLSNPVWERPLVADQIEGDTSAVYPNSSSLILSTLWITL